MLCVIDYPNRFGTHRITRVLVAGSYFLRIGIAELQDHNEYHQKYVGHAKEEKGAISFLASAHLFGVKNFN